MDRGNEDWGMRIGNGNGMQSGGGAYVPSIEIFGCDLMQVVRKTSQSQLSNYQRQVGTHKALCKDQFPENVLVQQFNSIS